MGISTSRKLGRKGLFFNRKESTKARKNWVWGSGVKKVDNAEH